MTLNDTQTQRLQNLNNYESFGLTTEKKQMVKQIIHYQNSWFLKSLEVKLVNQVLTKRRGEISFVADGPLEQFQIDYIYMPKSWFNNGVGGDRGS